MSGKNTNSKKYYTKRFNHKYEETWNEIAKIQAMADIEADMMDEDIRWVDELENN